ncbi:MAG: hypothetical protein IPJ24_04455 [bacterium]|nr:hypothetical protein [bacterium]
MKKRVWKTRISTGAVLLSAVLVVGGIQSPVFAREYMSAGQTGDPTDGEGVTESGGTTTNQSTISRVEPRTDGLVRWTPREIIVVVNGVVHRFDVQFLITKWKSK